MHALIDPTRPYSVTGVADSDPTRTYWVPYCHLFATPAEAEQHAINVWGRDWHVKRRNGIQLAIGIITEGI